MGQYRQWLHYRGIDQLLRSQLAVSQHELEQLQAQVEVLGKQFFSAENAIFQTLIASQQRPLEDSYAADEPAREPTKDVFVRETEPEEEIVEEEIVIEDVPEEEAATISPALFAWSRLPNFDTQIIQKSAVDSTSSPLETASARSHEQLLPPDIGAFIDTYTPTNSEGTPSGWLRALASSHENESATPSADRPAEHADYLVRRWFERWGQSSAQAKSAQED